MDPELLVNKSVSELPEGVDPCQREVGSASKMSGVYYMYSSQNSDFFKVR